MRLTRHCWKIQSFKIGLETEIDHTVSYGGIFVLFITNLCLRLIILGQIIIWTLKCFVNFEYCKISVIKIHISPHLPAIIIKPGLYCCVALLLYGFQDLAATLHRLHHILLYIQEEAALKKIF